MLFVKIATSLLITSILYASPIDKNAEPSEKFHNQPIPTESRIIIGSGAKVIIDGMASAKLWYDDIVLLSDAKLVENEEEQLNLINRPETDIENEVVESGLPIELSISKAYPNPFNPIVNISYGLPESGNVRILIHDLSGRKIAEYGIDHQSAGWHEFNWNAIDKRGQSVGSGIYLMTIQASDMVKQQKITYLK
jgi:hypothetical protein